MSPACIH